ncbi:MAG: hypothetical protein KAS65_05155 [Candidatus Aminicenantes bacterium]|nr:hypothetical protein [Candidatus Aminicenantes bacterium]
MNQKSGFSLWFYFILAILLKLIFFVQPHFTQTLFNEELLKIFQCRQLGPYRAGAWISDIDVPETPGEKHKYTFYVSARNGGVWKTTNNGTTFKPIFDQYGVNSIGSIRVDPSNPDIVWVGTGDASNTRSAYAGNGIYRSTDAGKTFQLMGLIHSHHIPKIIIHPGNSDIVYVAVMGHLFSENPERGLYKTIDRGLSWEKVLYINERVGVIDMAMDLNNPDVLYAATYEKQRSPWHYEAGGKESGIYKTVDGGRNWIRLKNGLPSGKIGRIGIDLYRKNAQIIYAVIENLNFKPGEELKNDQDAEFDAMKDPYFDRLIGGEVYRSKDSGHNWEKMNSETDNVGSKAAYSFNQIWIDPNQPENIFINSVHMNTSTDGGKTWKDLGWPPKHLFLNMFGDVRTFWINPIDSRHMMIGSDGGVYQTFDGGQTTDHLYHIPLGEIYQVEVDMAQPYNIYVGLQDHEAWRCASNSRRGEIGLEDWHLTGLWDGMYTKVDPQNNRWLYTTTQFGNHHRVDQKFGERINIMPKASPRRPPYRFTWTTPLEISPHNTQIIYTGGQMLLRSLNKGDSWEEISPDLTDNDPEKIAGRGHMMYNTITTISESPIKAGVIWVGTDDGRIHLTRDHGKTWEEFTKKINDLESPDEIYVSRVFASRNHLETAYVTKSGYRNDLFKPYVYRTRDGGKTWEDIAANLPDYPISVIFEDRDNPDILFIGNDIGVYISINGGKKWVAFKNNIPPVPVRDLLVHPRENDLIVGTYGRGAFLTDISPLRELNQAILNQKVHLFNIESKPKLNYSQQAYWGNHRLMGDRHLFTPNEPNGLVIYYYFKDKRPKPIEITIFNSDGNKMKSFKLRNSKGIHRVIWDTRKASPGIYDVVLKSGKMTIKKKARVMKAWKWGIGNQSRIR